MNTAKQASGVSARPVQVAPFRRRHRRSRGFTMVYVGVMIVILVAFVGLAIDVGRMQLTHTQLQVAADAGARAAANIIITNNNKDFNGNETAARTAARAVAGRNAVTAEDPRGQSIDVQLNSGNSDPAGDVVFGRWGKNLQTGVWQFTYLDQSQYASANAVKVVARRTGARGNPLPMWFASVVWRENADIKAEAIAAVSGGPFHVGIVGIDSLDVWGHAGTDSYDYEVEPRPDPRMQPELFGDEGDVLTTGPLDIWGNPLIRGDATADTITAPDGTITGEQNYIWDDFTRDQINAMFPPVDATEYESGSVNDNEDLTGYLDASNNFQMTSGTLTIPATGSTDDDGDGRFDYYIQNFTLGGNAQIIINAPTTIHIYGVSDVRGTINTLGVNDDPRNLRIEVDGAGTFDWRGTADLHGVIYAPEANVSTGGTNDIYGAVVGLNLDIFGDALIHYEIHSGFPIDRPYRARLVK